MSLHCMAGKLIFFYSDIAHFIFFFELCKRSDMYFSLNRTIALIIGLVTKSSWWKRVLLLSLVMTEIAFG